MLSSHPFILRKSRPIGHPVVAFGTQSAVGIYLWRGCFGRNRKSPVFFYCRHPPYEHRCRRYLIIGTLRVNSRRCRRRIAERRTGITDRKVIDNGIGLFQLKISRVIAIEVRFNIKLIVTESLVTSDYAKEETRSGRSRGQMFQFCWLRGARNY